MQKKSLLGVSGSQKAADGGSETKPATPVPPTTAKKLAVAKLATAKLSTAKLTTLRKLH
jgi:hypothetical protein